MNFFPRMLKGGREGGRLNVAETTFMFIKRCSPCVYRRPSIAIQQMDSVIQ